MAYKLVDTEIGKLSLFAQTFIKVMPWLPSKSFKRKPSTIVLHSTAGASANSTYNWLKSLKSPNLASYHFIIERDGTVLKCVPLSRIAYHAGKSLGPEGESVNNYSIGIAFANKNNGESYTANQIQSAYDLIKIIHLSIPITYLTAHYHISPNRKTDPMYFDFLGFSDRVATFLKIKPWRGKNGKGNNGSPNGHVL